MSRYVPEKKKNLKFNQQLVGMLYKTGRVILFGKHWLVFGLKFVTLIQNTASARRKRAIAVIHQHQCLFFPPD